MVRENHCRRACPSTLIRNQTASSSSTVGCPVRKSRCTAVHMMQLRQLQAGKQNNSKTWKVHSGSWVSNPSIREIYRPANKTLSSSDRPNDRYTTAKANGASPGEGWSPKHTSSRDQPELCFCVTDTAPHTHKFTKKEMKLIQGAISGPQQRLEAQAKLHPKPN